VHGARRRRGGKEPFVKAETAREFIKCRRIDTGVRLRDVV
jgi:hypothetical protein